MQSIKEIFQLLNKQIIILIDSSLNKEKHKFHLI